MFEAIGYTETQTYGFLCRSWFSTHYNDLYRKVSEVFVKKGIEKSVVDEMLKNISLDNESFKKLMIEKHFISE